VGTNEFRPTAFSLHCSPWTPYFTKSWYDKSQTERRPGPPHYHFTLTIHIISLFKIYSLFHLSMAITKICISFTNIFITLFDLQLDAQNSYLFTYNTFIKNLYMFRALP